MHVNDLNVTSVDGGLQSLQHVGINFIRIESRISKYVFDESVNSGCGQPMLGSELCQNSFTACENSCIFLIKQWKQSSLKDIKHDIGYDISSDVIYDIGYDIVILVSIACLNRYVNRSAWGWRSQVLRAIMLYRHCMGNGITALNWPLKSDFLEILDGAL